MQICQVVVGPLETNCYVVKEDHPDVLVVDPADEAEAILAAVAEIEGRIAAVVCTHGHPDHVGALREIVRATGAVVYVHPAELELLRQPWPDFGLREAPLEGSAQVRDATEGTLIRVGEARLRVMHTPGHRPGCICLLGEEFALTGDTLFAGGVGRTDLPGGNEVALAESMDRLRRELSPITLLYPGHGPATLMTQELTSNPWLAPEAVS
jgi:glyoxylase-like metal-dependent hydrolase (beta-lactamase superfamily II)